MTEDDQDRDRDRGRDRGRADKFLIAAEGATLSQCVYCRHAVADAFYPVCAAFPGAIPDAILTNRIDHRKPYLDPETGQPADMGIALERSITFEPRPDVPRDVLDRLYRALDALRE